MAVEIFPYLYRPLVNTGGEPLLGVLEWRIYLVELLLHVFLQLAVFISIHLGGFPIFLIVRLFICKALHKNGESYRLKETNKFNEQNR